MRVILLAAGLGTRLRPITNSIPKCLVPINGKPLLGIWLERLTQAGMGPFLINTHYLAEKVEAFIIGSAFKNQSLLINEFELRGTAGTLIDNLYFFDNKDGMLIHADNFCKADLASFAQAHINRPQECILTMMTFISDSPSSCGIVELNDHGVVVGFHEKKDKPPGNLANSAVYILSKEFLEIMGRDFKNVKDFSTEVIPRFLGRIFTYETREVFIDIGTIKSYEMANKKICESPLFSRP
jgi:mannose-1-phosphate guanylyltransferase